MGADCTSEKINASLKRVFPNHSSTLVDSGRSALAVIIETLQLSDSRMLVPAFLCNALSPILEQYNIIPIFVDIDPKTFQPNASSYTKELLEQCDSVLVVATYGQLVSKEILSNLKSSGKIIIEDYAHVQIPHEPVTDLGADARFYSIPKNIPAPDGGLAVIKQTNNVQISKHKVNITFIKNWLKLFKFFSFIIVLAKYFHKQTKTKISEWSGIRQPSSVTKKLFLFFLENKEHYRENPVNNFSYCYPILTKNPQKTVRKLLRHGITGERIWHDPISYSSYATNSSNKYTTTERIAKSIVCVPLWHIQDSSARFLYEKKLRSALSPEFDKF